MATAERSTDDAQYNLRFKLGILGSSAPVFPGFETDISERVGPRMQSWPRVQEEVLEPMAIYAHLPADGALATSHVVGDLLNFVHLAFLLS